MNIKTLNLQPKDIIAILVIVALVLFKLTGHNGYFDTPVALVIGYYFAHRKDKSDKGI